MNERRTMGEKIRDRWNWAMWWVVTPFCLLAVWWRAGKEEAAEEEEWRDCPEADGRFGIEE